MRVLFVCHRLPFPPDHGSKIRAFHILRHLGQNHELVVASLAHSEQELREGSALRDYCQELLAEVLTGPARGVQAFAACASPLPSSVAYFRCPRLLSRIKEVSARKPFDAVFVHCAFSAQYTTGIASTFAILDYCDLDSAKWFDYGRMRVPPLSWGYTFEGCKLRRFEAKIARRFDWCTFSTQGELSEFKALGVDVPCSVIPNGVDTNYYHPQPQAAEKAPVIVFLGRMDYFPNVDGVVHFAKRIFPLVRKSIPAAEFCIIGSNPTARVRDLAETPGIKVTGYVPDVRPHLIDAAVAVAPLRIARGVQNKVLECMAMGIPVLASSPAARGIQAVPGQHLIVADEPEEFACQLIRLLQDESLRQDFGRAARRQVESAHNWSLSMDMLDGLLEQAREAKAHSCQAGRQRLYISR